MYIRKTYKFNVSRSVSLRTGMFLYYTNFSGKLLYGFSLSLFKEYVTVTHSIAYVTPGLPYCFFSLQVKIAPPSIVNVYIVQYTI